MSSNYQDLLARMNKLESHFLPKKPSNVGRFSARQQDLIAAYIFMVHAELEAYIEGLASTVVERVFEAWKKNKNPTHVVWCLAFDHIRRNNKDLQVYELDDTIVGQAFDKYRKRLSANNGIREENLFNIYPPIGFSRKNFDTTWLSTISSFGALRGKVAHTSVQMRVVIDPIVERDKLLNQILPELKRIEARMNSLK